MSFGNIIPVDDVITEVILFGNLALLLSTLYPTLYLIFSSRHKKPFGRVVQVLLRICSFF